MQPTFTYSASEIPRVSPKPVSITSSLLKPLTCSGNKATLFHLDDLVSKILISYITSFIYTITIIFNNIYYSYNFIAYIKLLNINNIIHHTDFCVKTIKNVKFKLSTSSINIQNIVRCYRDTIYSTHIFDYAYWEESFMKNSTGPLYKNIALDIANRIVRGKLKSDEK